MHQLHIPNRRPTLDQELEIQQRSSSSFGLNKHAFRLGQANVCSQILLNMCSMVVCGMSDVRCPSLAGDESTKAICSTDVP
jgi:hypothetical protein